MNLSVIFVTPGTFPIPSFKTSSVENSIIHLAPFLAQKMNVSIIGRRFKTTSTSYFDQGVRYKNFVSTKDTYIHKVIEYCRSQEASIIQVENRPEYVNQIKRHIPNANVWLSLHSITFLQPAFIPLERLHSALQAADVIMVNSHFLKEYITRYFPLLEKKIKVNYLGVDEKKFASRFLPEIKEKRQSDLEKLKVNEKKIILYVGRLIPIKGVHHLIEAVDQLKHSYSNFVLYIVGGNTYGKNRGTPYVRRLKQMSRKNASFIRFIPFTPYSSMARWYRVADAVVVPSIGQEAFGLVNIEAMATGVPVIASKIGGIPEVVKDRSNGILVSLNAHVQGLAAAMYEILVNDQWAEDLGKKGREHVEEKFTWEQSAKRIYQYYESIINGREHRPSP